jgi:hypothetical protein
MSQTDVQKLQISWEMKEWEDRKKLMQKTFDLVNPRMVKLWNDELFLETVLVHSQTVEHYIKAIIQGHLVKRKILKILGENDPCSGIEVKLDEEEKTLGNLIGILRRFTGKTPLIQGLTNFNVKLRREVAHHIFDGLRNIEPLDADIKKFFGEKWNGSEFKEMVQGLADEAKKVDDQIKELIKKSE